jgi:hypothetical protein
MVAGAWEIIVGVFIAVALCLWIIREYERRRYPVGEETGDPMNPQAIKDWRKAKWQMERGDV